MATIVLHGKIRLAQQIRDNTKVITLSNAAGDQRFDVVTSSGSFSVDAQTGVLTLTNPLNFTIENTTLPVTFTKVIMRDEDIESPITPGQFIQRPMFEVPLDSSVTFTTDGIFTLNNLTVEVV
jgi:hypothetical protein